MTGFQNCGSYHEMLSAYLDGELSHTERAELLQHLATCRDCRRTLEEYRDIGTQLRALPPLHSPDDLTDAIYAQTVDAPPRRLFLLTNRVGYPVAAIAAVLLVFIVAVFLLIDGYQRGIDPTIVGSEPAAGVTWSPNNPISIAFNKEMDRESVEAAITIQPTSEALNLDVQWDGNTLIIGGNQPLKSGTSYEVNVTTDARDKWGNPLSEPFTLSFATGPGVQLTEAEPRITPTPTPEPSPTAEPKPENATTASGSATSMPATATPRPEGASSDPAATRTPAPPEEPTSTPSSGAGEGVNGAPQPTEPVNEPQVEDPDPTATTTPPPTMTPEPVPTDEPTAIPPTATPEPSATPEPEPTEEPATPTVPEATPTPETIAVAGSFGNVYWSNETVEAGLGEPLDAERQISARELDFQRGKMFQNLETNRIYVMETAGVWSSVLDTSGDALPEFVETSEEGIWEPGGVFGYVWQEQSWVEDTLGYAVEMEIQEFESTVQEFENGLMLTSADGFIYVLFTSDLTWELYPDAGPLSDDDGESSEP